LAHGNKRIYKGSIRIGVIAPCGSRASAVPAKMVELINIRLVINFFISRVYHDCIALDVRFFTRLFLGYLFKKDVIPKYYLLN
jgi:hypothetical protein